MAIPEEAQRFLMRYGQLKNYPKHAIFSYPDEPKYYWCFILEGLIAALHYPDQNRPPTIRWFSIPYSYFTGTEHPFTKKSNGVHLEVLKNSTLLLLSGDLVIEAQARHPAISELFHILKQHQLTRFRKYVSLLQQKDDYERYKILVEELPEIVQYTTTLQQAQFLQMSRGWFFKLKKRYLLENFKKSLPRRDL